MPTSITNLLKTSGLSFEKLQTVKWGDIPFSKQSGIYIVSTCENPSENVNLYSSAPIDINQLESWIIKVKTLRVDNDDKTTSEKLFERLNQFWSPDENILYIGQTECKNGIKGRVGQYYKTELGNKSPHAGGQWLKTLSILDKLFIHYFPIDNPKIIEVKLLYNFINQVSKQTLEKLRDNEMPLPFANLEIKATKKHGINNNNNTNQYLKLKTSKTRNKTQK